MTVEPPQPPADQLDWEPALAYLEALSAPDFDPGLWAGGEQLGPHHYSARYVVLSAESQRFMVCLYDTGIVAATDWNTWLTQGGQAFYDDPDRLAGATLEQCRMLLIAHARTDRFVEGHLLEVLRNGHLVQLLQRVRELVDDPTGAICRRPPGFPAVWPWFCGAVTAELPAMACGFLDDPPARWPARRGCAHRGSQAPIPTHRAFADVHAVGWPPEGEVRSRQP